MHFVPIRRCSKIPVTSVMNVGAPPSRFEKLNPYKQQNTRIIISISNTFTFFVRWWTIKVIFTSIALNSSITSFTWALTVTGTIFTFWTNRVTVASSKIEKDLSYLLGNPHNTENWLMALLFRCEKLYAQLHFNIMNHSTWVSWKKAGIWG